MVHRESHQTFYKASFDLSISLTSFQIKSLVMFWMKSFCFCDVPPEKVHAASDNQSVESGTFRWMCVFVCVDEHILGTSTVFLKWNRITGDSRVGQDNRRSQIALQSKFKSSYA